MIWINFASFISASWGILITCLVCFRMKQFKCPLCPLSHFLSLFFVPPGRGDEKNKVSLFHKWCLKMLAVFFFLPLNGKNSVNAKLIIIVSVKICPIHIVSTCAVSGSVCVDSRFARCIFIWRCRRIPTLPDPSPARSPCLASLWQQVELRKRCAFDVWSD